MAINDKCKYCFYMYLNQSYRECCAITNNSTSRTAGHVCDYHLDNLAIPAIGSIMDEGNQHLIHEDLRDGEWEI